MSSIRRHGCWSGEAKIVEGDGLGTGGLALPRHSTEKTTKPAITPSTHSRSNSAWEIEGGSELVISIANPHPSPARDTPKRTAGGKCRTKLATFLNKTRLSALAVEEPYYPSELNKPLPTLSRMQRSLRRQRCLFRHRDRRVRERLNGRFPPRAVQSVPTRFDPKPTHVSGRVWVRTATSSLCIRSENASP